MKKISERRMFAKSIIDSDSFLDMPLSTQSLYFHLGMRADDEGFVNNPKKIERMIGASDDDLRVLIAKRFIIAFESGVVVIKHWKIHNYIRGDRLVKTAYQKEKDSLTLNENGAYTEAPKIDTALLESSESEDCTDARKSAYKNSSLPYSFSYKMKRAFDGQICPICGKTMSTAYRNSKPTIQHNIPISKGGVHELENISVICFSCNASIRNNETGELNNKTVIAIWDKIANVPIGSWFSNPWALFDDICQPDDSQMTDECQHRLGKDRLGKDRLNQGNKKENKKEKSDESFIAEGFVL